MHCAVLIVGGGFGGAFAARELESHFKRSGHRIVLVAPENFLLFSPLLPEAASGTIEPRHAVIPLRELLATTEVLIGRVTQLDPTARTAVAVDVNGEAHAIEYDAAILSPGSVPTVFPIPGLTEHAVGFKTLADAIWLRNRVLHQIDAATASNDPETRRRLLTFTFIGGGYAGVEAAAELESLSRDAARRYPRIAPEDFRWVVIEAQGSLLPGLHPELAQFTERVLSERGIEVYTNTRLASCDGGVVTMSPSAVEPYGSGTIVWTAGQRPNPVATDWGLPLDDHGSIPVDDHMQVEGVEALFAVGDVAAAPAPEGGLAPNTAQHAMRQGVLAGRNAAALFGEARARPFTYRNRGLAVTLGKWQGTAQVRKFTFRGPLAWWMGRSYHLLMMPGIGRKLRVVSDWTMSLLFKRDVSQLGQLGRPSPLEP
jgi:NADH dehydrogenase